MHHVRQRIDLSVENQIQPHELIGLLRAILRIHRAIALTHLMGQCEHQRARTCSRIVDGHIGVSLRSQNAPHDVRDGVGGEVFAVAAGILVVILDEIFEHLRKEVVPLREHVGEAEVN